jgi:hypothetical protein
MQSYVRELRWCTKSVGLPSIFGMARFRILVKWMVSDHTNGWSLDPAFNYRRLAVAVAMAMAVAVAEIDPATYKNH